MQDVGTDFSYISLDQVCAFMTPGSYMSILDIKSAFRSVNVYPDHRQFQGIMWDVNGNGILQPMVDNCLCFSLKSALFFVHSDNRVCYEDNVRVRQPRCFWLLGRFHSSLPNGVGV